MKVKVENLSFSYPKAEVLRDISFDMGEREFLCILGPNGSGKSTLVKCIEGLLRPDKGRILLDGSDRAAISRRETARLIGYVPQSGGNVFSDTVFDTVLMGRKPYYSWRCGDRDMDAVASVLQLLELDDLALTPFCSLSGGQQQRVLIARALAQEPRLLLLDEPTSALDIAHQLEVMEILAGLVRSGNLSVAMVVHDLNLASRYADRLLLLSRGRIHSCGNPRVIMTVETLAAVYGVDADIHYHGDVVSVSPVKRIPSSREKVAIRA